jgi:hypothetical protein
MRATAAHREKGDADVLMDRKDAVGEEGRGRR